MFHLFKNKRSICDLLVHCEVRTISSRITAAVVNFFIIIANSIKESYCQFKDRVIDFFDPKKRFTTCLMEIPEDQREAFVRDVLSAITIEMDPATKDIFIQTVAANNKDTLIQNIRPLITAEMYSSRY